MSEPERIRVLHVDDDPDFAALAADMLEREDDRFTVDTATSASEGLEKLANDGFDCVVSDYEMPGQNGIEFLETVRESRPDLPFILYTGKGSESVASDAISAGVTDYLRKSSGTEQYALLANRIRNAVESYHAERAHQRQLEAIESAHEGISILDEDGEFIYVNEQYADIYGYDPEEMLGEHWELIYPDEEVAMTRQEILPAVAEDGYWHGESTGLRADGTTFPEDHVVSQTAHGDFVCTVRDLTDERERETELRLKTRAMDEAPLGITISDPSQDDNPLIYANERFEELTGYDREEIIGRNCRFLQGDGTDSGPVAAMREAIDAQEPVTVELRNYRKDGTEFWNRVHIAPIESEDGEVTNFVGFQEDVTDHKEREQAIEDLHSTARALMEAGTVEEIADVGVGAAHDILDMPVNGVHLYDESEAGLAPVAWSDRAEELVGEPPTFEPGEGLAGRAFETGEAHIYDDLSIVPERYNQDTDVRSEIVLPLGDHGVLLIGSPEVGAFDDTDVSLARILAAHMTTALDNVERQRQLRDQTARLEALYENSPDMIDVLDPDGRLLDVNQRFCDELGYVKDELLGRRIWDIDRLVDAEDVRTLLSDFETGDRRKFEGEYERADGSTFPVEVHLLRLDIDGHDRFLAISRDISERKERERELERQNDRLDKFASVVSHDLRNPLNVADGQLELARRECESDHLDDVARAHDRMDALIDDLLTLARQGEQVDETTSVTLADVVEECWQNVDTADATLVAESERTVRADASRLKQLLENLFRNAVEHAGDDVTVTVGDVEGGFYVADDGPGIPEDERQRVFDAGYSTAQKGTGFGLNIVREIVEAHGWNVTVTDSETGGARFEITGVTVDDA